jgi:uncharacterized membrane protein required for colicin V production
MVRAAQSHHFINPLPYVPIRAVALPKSPFFVHAAADSTLQFLNLPVRKLLMFGAKLPMYQGTAARRFMTLPHLVFSWVDFLTVLVLMVGIMRGRKRGLSEELLDTVQWVAIVVAAGLFYRPLAALIGTNPILSPVTYGIVSYILIALVIKLVFTMLKKQFGQKLVDSDVFGRVEFYFGMIAGSVRWTCIYLFFLSILHAPTYSDSYRAQKAKSDEYNFGDISFPSIMSLQDEVYKVSYTGKYSAIYLAPVLMDSTGGDSKQLRGDNSLAKRRERDVDAAFGSK